MILAPSIALVAGLLTGGSLGPPKLATQTRNSTSPGPRSAVSTFFVCLRQPTRCNPRRVFTGRDMRRLWAMLMSRAGAIQVRSARLVARPVGSRHSRWNRRWKAQLSALSAAGYKRQALQTLGRGRSIVQPRTRVALALVGLDILRGGRRRQELLTIVLWQTSAGWRVAFADDNPSSVRRFLLKHRR